MDIKALIIPVLQFLLLELGKKVPKVGTWIQDHVPSVLAILTTVINVLTQVVGAHAGTLAMPAGPDPGDMTGELLNNYVGTIVVDNVVKKIIWRYLFGKVFKLKAAQPK